MYQKYAYMVDVMEKKKQILEEMMDGVNTIHSTMKESLRTQSLIRSQKVLIPRKDMMVNEMAGYKKQPQVISKINTQSNLFSRRLTAGKTKTTINLHPVARISVCPSNTKGSYLKSLNRSRQRKRLMRPTVAPLTGLMQLMENMI